MFCQLVFSLGKKGVRRELESLHNSTKGIRLVIRTINRTLERKTNRNWWSWWRERKNETKIHIDAWTKIDRHVTSRNWSRRQEGQLLVTFWGALTPKNFYKPVVSCLEEGRGVAQREREKITCTGLSYIGVYHSLGREKKETLVSVS